MIKKLIKILLTYFVFHLCFTIYATPNKTTEAMKLIPNIKNGEKLYGICSTCHGDNGWGKDDGSFPVIAGQHRSVIIKQLIDIRARNRDNPTMYPFSGNDVIDGPQALEDVAEYISRLPESPHIGVGAGTHLENGKKIFKQLCSACHGDKGEGDATNFYPRIQGQHYAYILRQLQWMRDGRRKNANSAMLAIIKNMDDATFKAVADYLSRIKLDVKAGNMTRVDKNP